MSGYDNGLYPFEEERASSYSDRERPSTYPGGQRPPSSQFKRPLPSSRSTELEAKPTLDYPVEGDQPQTRRLNPASTQRSQPGKRPSSRGPSTKTTRRAHRQYSSRWQQRLARLGKNPWFITTMVLLLLLVGGAGTTALLAYTRVNQVQGSLASAQDHLRQAQALLPQLSKSPLNHALLESLHAQVAGAESDFRQAQAQAAALAPAQHIPGQSQKVFDALTIIQMGVDLTSGAREVLDALLPIADGLHGVVAAHPTASASPTAAPTASTTATATPVSTPAPPPALTAQAFITAQAAVNDAQARVNAALQLRKQIHDNGASLGAAAVKSLASFDHLTPSLAQGFSDVTLLLQAAPVVLGIQQPITYLIEILDASELRSGGGFIGNYGVVTLDTGRITNVTVRDSYLLDDPYLYGQDHARPFPASYSWFPLASRMGLRDSDLSPDFVFDAQTAEQIYTEESGGQQVSGVIAISPTLIANLLTVTGPVYVPQYNVTVTSANLVTLIHYYQFQTNDQGVPSGDGQSSTRKHFTAVLGEDFFAHLRSLSAAQQEQALQVGFNALKTKDLQVYLNNQAGETLLQKTHLSNDFELPQTDTFEVVDNNIGGNKATAYVQETVSDSVVVAPDGSSSHSVTIGYTYKPEGDVYGRITFRNIVQVYVPLGSQLTGSSGFSDPPQTFTTATREFWSAYIAVLPNTSHTVTFSWKAPAPPEHAQGYELLVDRQADSVYSFSVSIQLPTLTTPVQSFPPLTYANGKATYQTRGQQTTNLDLKLSW